MDIISKYEILETINKSGPNAVYIARHTKLNRKTLLKVYSGADHTLIDRFEREAKIVADLNSNSVVSIYDYGEEENLFYISMEFVDGSNLAEYLIGHPITVDQIIDFTHQITKALSTLHSKGYIHRDLKPENILVDNDLKIKLTDFGLSIHQSLKRVTSEGTILGTPMYMSPEQINNLPVDFSSDIFSFGIILYQMASAIHPFEAPQVGEIFSKILSADPEPLKKICSSVPEWFAGMVHKMLNKDPKKRYQNAVELLKFIEGHVSPAASATNPDSEKPPTSKKGIIQLFVPVIIIFLLSVFYYLYFYAKDPVALTPTQDSSSVARPDTTININDDHTSAYTVAIKDTVAIPMTTNPIVTKPKIRVQANNTPHRTYTFEESDHTQLLIRTSPWCSIYINYELFDKTPMTNPSPLNPGKYLLGLQNPLYPSLSDSIEIRENKLNIYDYHLDSTFFKFDLEVSPWGKVMIDGKLIGTTPLLEPIYLARQNHILEIQNDYFPTWRDTLRWNGEALIERKIVLNDNSRRQD